MPQIESGLEECRSVTPGPSLSSLSDGSGEVFSGYAMPLDFFFEEDKSIKSHTIPGFGQSWG